MHRKTAQGYVPLKACRSKRCKKGSCKAAFPKDKLLSSKMRVVCAGLARKLGLRVCSSRPVTYTSPPRGGDAPPQSPTALEGQGEERRLRRARRLSKWLAALAVSVEVHPEKRVRRGAGSHREQNEREAKAHVRLDRDECSHVARAPLPLRHLVE